MYSSLCDRIRSVFDEIEFSDHTICANKNIDYLVYLA